MHRSTDRGRVALARGPGKVHDHENIRSTYCARAPAARAAFIARARAAVQAILRGEDDRLLVIVGPCSIHEPESAIEYARRLRDFAPRAADALHLVMRVYFEKPRTRLGWKGLIYDPDLDGRGNIGEGLRRARRILLECARMGVPAAAELR